MKSLKDYKDDVTSLLIDQIEYDVQRKLRLSLGLLQRVMGERRNEHGELVLLNPEYFRMSLGQCYEDGMDIEEAFKELLPGFRRYVTDGLRGI